MNERIKIFKYSLFIISVFAFFSIVSTKAQTGCPSVNAGSDVTLNCTSPGPTTLTATPFAPGITTTYTVSPIAYAPPNPYTAGNPVIVGEDDVWSSVINLPFHFCFFGNSYNTIQVGANGIISFSSWPVNSFGTCDWCIGGPDCTWHALPSNQFNTATPQNAIMGPYQDIDPTNCATLSPPGGIYWQLIGSSPCRMFVVSYYNIPYYGDPNSVNTTHCPSALSATSQIVLYETTNAIDIYIQNKDICPNWNGGLAIEGIQNAAGTLAYTVPGRNNTQWTTTNDAYRFTPSGAPNYTVTWSPATGLSATTGTSVTANPAATTTYTATAVITDCDGSQVSVSDNVTVTIDEVTPTCSVSPVAPSYCPGGNVLLTASGSGSTYAWSPGGGLSATTGAIVTASPTITTTYTITTTDASGCTGTTSTVVTVAQPAPNITGNSPICPGSTATLDAGAGYSSYSWSTNATTETIPVTTAGTYTVTVHDASGCSGTNSSAVVVNANFTPVITGPSSICSGTTATLVAGGGYSSYSWSNNATTQTIPVTTAGTYTVTVHDGSGCSGTNSAAIAVNTSPTPVITGPTSICSGTTANLDAGGGYSSYSWSNNATTQTIPVTTAGTYTVTVSTTSGCTGTTNFALIVIPNPPANAGTDQIICQGQNVNLTASGGGTYLWSDSAKTQSTNISPLITTTYTVTVTNNGCTADANVTVHVNNLPTANAGPNQSICIGQNASLSASGGNTYTWSPAASLNISSISNPIANPTTTTPYIVTVTDNNGCSAKDTMVLTVNQLPVVSAGTNQSICIGQSASLNATGGINYLWSPAADLNNSSIDNPIASPTDTTTYTVTVTDLHSCTNTSNVVINVNPIPTSSFTATDPICAGQTSSSIIYTGTGKPGDNYFWNFPGGTIISGSGQGPYQVSWTAPATYTLNLTVEENGCTSPVTTIPVIVGNVTSTIAIVDSISCNGVSDGQVIANPLGTLPYQCNWSNNQISPIATNLSANIAYTVTVTDGNGCTSTQSITLTQPPPLSMAFTTHAVSCFNGHNGIADAVVSGGTHSYTYSWLPAGTCGNTNVVNTLHAGTYSLHVQDMHGCSLDTTFVISQPPVLTYTFTTDSTICSGGRNGAICFHTTGGTSPYSFTWNPNISTDSCVTNIASGNYLVTITDNNKCDTLAMATIGQPQPIILHVSSNVTICIGQSTVISANANGGVGPYIFTWDNSLGVGNSFTVSPTTTTTYNVSVTDHNNCATAPLSVTVTVNPPISLSVTASPSSFCIGGSSIITAAASGGNSIYTYTWGQGIGVSSGAITVAPTTTTWYPITVTDDCGSPLAIDSVEIFVYPMPVVMFSADTLRGCEPLGVNFTDLSTPTINTWLWDFDDPMSGTNNTSSLQNPYHLFSLPGVYSISLTVNTIDSCSGSYTHNSMIDVYIIPKANFGMTPQTGSTALNPDIIFTDLSVNAYTWAWNFGDPISSSDTSNIENPEHTYNSAGNYTVTLNVESIHGCKDSVSKEMLIKPDVFIYYPNAFTPNGDAYNPGWRPEGVGVDNTNYKCYIYDRWGKMIWKTNDFYAYWDGHAIGSDKVCELGVYSYIAFANDVNGNNYQFTGRITLVK